jgi:hypothetical protein
MVEHLNKDYSIHKGEAKATLGWLTGSWRSIWQAWRDLASHSEGYKTAMPLNFYMGTVVMLSYFVDVFMK